MAITREMFESQGYDKYMEELERKKFEDIRRKMYETPQLMPKYADLPRDAREQIEDGRTHQLDAIQYEMLLKIRAAERHQKEQAARREKEEQDALMASPAMTCSISVGIDLWIAKFGDGWVQATSTMETPDAETGGMNWSMLYTRLKRLNKMEEHGPFCRIVT